MCIKLNSGDNGDTTAITLDRSRFRCMQCLDFQNCIVEATRQGRQIWVQIGELSSPLKFDPSDTGSCLVRIMQLAQK